MSASQLRFGALVGIALVAVVIASRNIRVADSGKPASVSAGAATIPAQGKPATSARMSMAKWDDLIRDRERRADSIPSAFRKWLATDYESALIGLRDLAKIDPDLANRACYELDFVKDGPEIERILDFANRTLKGDTLHMFQAGLAVALAGQNPVQALELFADSGISNGEKLYPDAQRMLDSVFRRSSAADPAAVIFWAKRHQAEKFPVRWDSICSGMAPNHGKPLDINLLKSLVAAMPSDAVLATKYLFLCGPNSAESRQANSHALLACLPDDPAGTGTQMRASLLDVVARHSPDLFRGGDYVYQQPKDAYSIGQGLPKVSLETDLAWANAITVPETRDFAIKGVVHGMLEEDSHFTSDCIRRMRQDDPMRQKAVLAMVEWLAARGMTQEAAPWREQLSR